MGKSKGGRPRQYAICEEITPTQLFTLVKHKKVTLNRDGKKIRLHYRPRQNRISFIGKVALYLLDVAVVAGIK